VTRTLLRRAKTGILRSVLAVAYVVRFALPYGLIAPSAGATAAVVLQTERMVIIAVDGKATAESRRRGTVFYNACKITVDKSKGFAAVAAGMNAYQPTKFDIQTELSQAMRQAGSVGEARDIADKTVAKDMTRAEADLKRRFPDQFRKSFAGGIAHGIEYLIAGVEPPYGQTVTSLTELVVDKTTNITVKNYPLRRTGRQQISNSVLGTHGEITDYMKKNPTWYGMENLGSLLRIARDLIQIEINAKPDDVGPPISILTIDNHGMHWIAPGVCQQ
jgi:hypothetical protein